MVATPGAGALRSRLRDLLTDPVAGAGCDLEDVEVTPAGRRRVVRVVVDRDGGVPLDTVAAVSTAVSEALDGSDVLGEAPYVLEVTSPGVDRPLTEPRHWRRARGRRVQAVRRDGTTVLGRLVDAGEDQVVLATDAGDRVEPLAGIARGQVQVDFTRTEEPPGGAGTGEA